MHEDMMATADTAQLEAELRRQAAQIAEGHVGHLSACEPTKEPPLIHDEDRTPGLGWHRRTTRDWRDELQTVHFHNGYRIEIIEQ